MCLIFADAYWGVVFGKQTDSRGNTLLDYIINKLPIPFFIVIHTRKTIGRFSCEYNENGDIKNPIIEISDRYEYTEAQLKDIIVHEMLHYYLDYTHQNEPQEHGKRWKQMALFFNEKFGTNIQI